MARDLSSRPVARQNSDQLLNHGNEPASSETRTGAISPRKVCRKQPSEDEDLSVSRQQVAAGEIFQEKITTRTKEYDNRNGQELHQTQHQSSIPRKHGSLDTGSFA